VELDFVTESAEDTNERIPSPLTGWETIVFEVDDDAEEDGT
jgi:hypothetical protein